jgi:hypothetical protein
MGKFAFVIVALLGLGTVGVVIQNSNADCIEVYTDFRALGQGYVSSECIKTSNEMTAFEVLKQAGYSTEGTVEYGDAVLCRLNNMPDISAESCEGMPPAESYWAVLIKEHQLIPMPFGISGEWGWAQVGINEINLKPGDSIGLVFADNGEVKFP